MEVRPITAAEAKPWIMEQHYARRQETPMTADPPAGHRLRLMPAPPTDPPYELVRLRTHRQGAQSW